MPEKSRLSFQNFNIYYCTKKAKVTCFFLYFTILILGDFKSCLACLQFSHDEVSIIIMISRFFQVWSYDDRNSLRTSATTYNQFHNIFRLFGVLPNFPFTTSETMGDYELPHELPNHLRLRIFRN